MPADLRALMAQPAFDVRARVAVDEQVLAAPLTSAHSSDLLDPTPWLEAGALLLTDGAQFLPTPHADAEAYVARLVDHGVFALGIAVGILHKTIPDALLAACDRHGLPLLEISARTPFMAMIRFVADARAADDRALLERSLRAQRRVVRAALRPDGLHAILRELERSLDCWVALFDAAGNRLAVPMTRGVPAELSDDVDAAAADALAGGRTAAVRIVGSAGRDSVTMQTLGQRGSLRGVLAVGIAGDAFDHAATDLLNSVIALTSISLEQSSTLDSARRRLRSGVLELLTSGAAEVAGRTARHLWGQLPREPIRVARLIVPGGEAFGTHPVVPALELLAEARAGSLFFAEQDDAIVVIVTDDDRLAVRDLALRHHVAIGFSTATGWAQLGESLTEARRAAARTSDRRPEVLFDDLAQAGILGHLEQTRAHQVARQLLLPIADAPELRTLLEVWLAHNGAWGPAAAELGIHRHTLRNRVDHAGRRLGIDLETFGARAELWHALQLTAA